MKIIERTPISTAAPVDPDYFIEHLRVTEDDALRTLRYAFTAAREVEDYANIALLDQRITAITDPLPDQVLPLPIGPVPADATVTVDLIEQDGSFTSVPSGWFLQAGRWPALHFDTTPGGQLRIIYEAGFGEDASAIPDDLAHAIMDQAARLYDLRGDTDGPATMAPSTARICARYRRVAVSA